MSFRRWALARPPARGVTDRCSHRLEIKMNRREKIYATIAITASTTLALGILELLFRTALFSDSLAVDALRQPWRYADSTIDENYWKLLVIFNSSNPQADLRADPAGRIHPGLGWAPEVTPENPLGLISDRKYAISEVENPLLFYGDSFVAGSGAARVSHRIPQLLDRMLPSNSVLNFGVGGYGIDQILLRLQSTIDMFESPLILVGILTDDVDRSIFGIRGGQKPYFELDSNRLALRNLPILPDVTEYVRQNPPTIRSYLFRFSIFRLRNFLPESWFDRVLGYDAIHRDNLVVNEMLLREIKREADSRKLEIACVLFYSREEILRPAEWRETFLQDSLENLQIPYFDTKLHLRQFLAHENMLPNDLYYEANNHLNEKGNLVVAEGLHAWLVDSGLLPRQ